MLAKQSCLSCCLFFLPDWCSFGCGVHQLLWKDWMHLMCLEQIMVTIFTGLSCSKAFGLTLQLSSQLSALSNLITVWHLFIMMLSPQPWVLHRCITLHLRHNSFSLLWGFIVSVWKILVIQKKKTKKRPGRQKVSSQHSSEQSLHLTVRPSNCFAGSTQFAETLKHQLKIQRGLWCNNK